MFQCFYLFVMYIYQMLSLAKAKVIQAEINKLYFGWLLDWLLSLNSLSLNIIVMNGWVIILLAEWLVDQSETRGCSKSTVVIN